MNEQQDLGQLGQRVSELGGMFREFLQRDERYKEELARTIRTLDDKAGNAGRTDLGVLATWAGVIITIVVAIGGSIGYLEDRNQTQNQQWIVRELDHHWDAIGKMNGNEIQPDPIPVNHRARKLTAREYLDQK